MKTKIRNTKKGTKVAIEDLKVLVYSDTYLEARSPEEILAILHTYSDWILKVIPIIVDNENLIQKLLQENHLQADYRFGQRSEKMSVVAGKESSEKGGDASGSPEAANDRKTNSDESLKESGGASEEFLEPPASKDKVKEKPRRSDGCMNQKYGKLPVHDIHVTYTEEQKEKLFGTSQLNEAGEEIVEEIGYVPGHFFIRRYHIHTYKTPKGKIVRPMKAGDVKMKKGSRFSAELMAFVAEQRFFLMTPYARLEKYLKTYGFHISRQLMAAKMIQYSFELFEPVIGRMWFHLKRSGYIQADETFIRILTLLKNNPSKRCFMWEFMTSELCTDAPKVVIYHYDESWAYDVVEELLGDFDGHLISDGKDAYHIFGERSNGNVTNCGCLSHLRNKFVKVLKAMGSFKSLPKDEKWKIPAYRILVMLSWIFKIDGLAGLEEHEKRLEFRQGAVSIMFDEMMEYIKSLDEADFEDGKYMHEALVYARNQEPYLREFLNDPHVPNNNSAAERNHARFANLRSNIKMINSIDGAIATADAFSLVSTARENGANIYYYFLYILKELPEVLRDIPDRDYGVAEELDRFMPWSDEYRNYEEEQLRQHGDMITENSILENVIEYIHPTLD